MRICAICPEMGNSGGNAFIGGHVNAVFQLSKTLFDRGHEITIITTPHRYPGNYQDKDIFDGWAEVYTLPISSSYPSTKYGLEYTVKTIQKVKELHKRKKFDIIHGHSGFSTPALITGISAKVSNLPSVHSIYCPIQIAGGNVVRLFSNDTLSKFYFSRVDKIIAVTGNIRRSLIKIGITENKIAEISLGINTELYNPDVSGDAIRRKYSIDLDQPAIIYVGNLTIQKGLPILIDALNNVVKETPNFKLFMVLNLPLEKYENPGKLDMDMGQLFKIKEKIKHYGLEDNIIPLGLLNNMPQFIAASNFLITPFLNTIGIVDYPTSMLEAMAVGKPIIATNVGGIPEIIKHKKNGMLVRPNDTNELTNAIIQMLENIDEAKNMGKEAAKTIVEKFRFETVANELEELYTGVILNHSSNRRH